MLFEKKSGVWIFCKSTIYIFWKYQSNNINLKNIMNEVSQICIEKIQVNIMNLSYIKYYIFFSASSSELKKNYK